MHKPVLLKEVIEILNPKPGEFFIDGTVGGGGHSLEILKKIGKGGIFLGMDWDEKIIEQTKSKLDAVCQMSDVKCYFVHGNYADLPEILKENNLPKADGLILDLGMSSIQLERSGRGFSFLKDEPLDMRYDIAESLTAAEVINSFRENDLNDIFWKYGEERYSRRIAKKIVEERKEKRILTTFDLTEIIKRAVPKNYERGRIYPSTRVFQALRIYVNCELENLEKLLKNMSEILKHGGRVAIISFHSLEDRLVKNYFRETAKKGKAEILTKKPIEAIMEEIQQNPRARSAKMRAIKII
ncbi:MAG: 16S rRNA (cytosine(1402)-N(4))-methyltransferase RsmH [Patescibacteria group bacterium]